MIRDPKDHPDTYAYPAGCKDQDFYDLQTYLEGGTEESRHAARRMDERAVANGQLSPEGFRATWGELPKRSGS